MFLVMTEIFSEKRKSYNMDNFNKTEIYCLLSRVGPRPFILLKTEWIGLSGYGVVALDLSEKKNRVNTKYDQGKSSLRE